MSVPEFLFLLSMQESSGLNVKKISVFVIQLRYVSCNVFLMFAARSDDSVIGYCLFIHGICSKFLFVLGDTYTNRVLGSIFLQRSVLSSPCNITYHFTGGFRSCRCLVSVAAAASLYS